MPTTHTIEDIARKAMGLVNAGDNFLLAASWASERYREFLRKVRPRILRKTAEINTVASISTGAITATRGSASLTADAAAQAVLTSAVNGRFIRLKTSWYEIATYISPTITLTAQYSEESVTDSTYKIVARHYSLPAAVRHYETFVHPRQRLPLNLVPLSYLDSEHPERSVVSDLIEYIADAGVDSSGYRRIEIYPATDNIEMLRYTYWEDPADLSYSSSLPQFIDTDVLLTGTLCDVLRFKASLAADGGKAEVAQFYANWAAREETRWLQKVKEAAKAMKAYDDSTSTLLGFGGRRVTSGDIKTAQDHIVSQWSPLS